MTIPRRLHGYDSRAINALLEEVRAAREELTNEITGLQAMVEAIQAELSDGVDVDRRIREVVVSAQRDTDQRRADALREAEAIKDDARSRTQRRDAELREEADRIRAKIASIRELEEELHASSRLILTKALRQLEERGARSHELGASKAAGPKTEAVALAITDVAQPPATPTFADPGPGTVASRVAPPDSLKALVVRGVAWKALSQITAQVSRIVVAVILARLLAPADYGLAGMALVFSGAVLLFSDLGFSQALIQRKDLSQKDSSTAFWTTATVGLVLAGIGVALSGPIASFYGEPDVKALFAAISAGFFIAGLGSTQTALLTREMRFRSLEIRTILATFAGAAAGIGMAFAGFGAWAIIGQQLSGLAAAVAAVWFVSSWRPRLAYSRASLRKIGGFGANVLGTTLSFYVSRNADNLLVGKFLGAASLGVYSVAYNIMLLPLTRLMFPLQEVLFPALARIQDDRKRTIAIWIRATRVTTAAVMPVLVGLAIVAPDFIVVILGDRWEGAIPVVRVLTWVALIQSISSLGARILTAQDRTSLLFRFAAASALIYVTAFAIGLEWGVVGVAVAYAAAATGVVPFFLYLTCRTLGASMLGLLRGLAGVTQASIIMGACVLGARLVLAHEGLPAGARLAITVALGVVVYLVAVAWRAPEVIAEIRTLRGRRSATDQDLRECAAP